MKKWTIGVMALAAVLMLSTAVPAQIVLASQWTGGDVGPRQVADAIDIEKVGIDNEIDVGQKYDYGDLDKFDDSRGACQTGGKGGKGGAACCCRPRWQVSMDALIMRREHMDAVPLVVDTNTNDVLLDASDIGLSHRGGLRLAASRQIINCCNDVEFEFFFVDQWSAFGTFDAPGAEFTVYGADFGTSPITLGYGNDLYSFELNWRRAWASGRIKTLLGFRVMELDENMTVLDGVSPPELFLGDIDNHLIGFQLGVEGIIWESCRWQIEGGMKAGVYHNEADFDFAFPQGGTVFNAAADHTTFAGEVWLGANYYVTNSLALRLGYQAMWIEGVAVLPEQLDDVAVPLLGTLDMGGSPFYHGFYFGAQLDF